MRKNMKKTATAILAAAIVFTQSIPAFAAEANTVACTSSYDTADFAGKGYQGNNNGQGPITISKATLTNDNRSEEIYFIGLCGTDFVEGQATGIVTDIVAGFNLSNPYLKAAKNAIMNGEKIPAGSKLVLTGHSLGGMVAQQLAADCRIKANYEVLYTVTFGAPLISAGFREGSVTRLGDTNDFIPYLSTTGAILPIWQIAGLVREDGGFGAGLINGWTAHNQSYGTLADGSRGNNCWAAYDALGHKNGNAVITYDEADVHYYFAPTKW